MQGFEQSYLPQRENESKQVRELASFQLSQLNNVSDRTAFMKRLTEITNEVIGASDAKAKKEKINSTTIDRVNSSKPSESDRTLHVDKDLLKTPSGQMLQKLKDLRASINSNISGDGPVPAPAQDNRKTSVKEDMRARAEKKPVVSAPAVERAPARAFPADTVRHTRKSHPVHVAQISPNAHDDDDVSVMSDASEMDSPREDESVASFSIGDYVLRFQKYFTRQLSHQNYGGRGAAPVPNKCGIDELLSGLSKDTELRDHVPQEKLHVVRSRLVDYHHRHCTAAVSMATFVSLVVAASGGHGSECGSECGSVCSSRSEARSRTSASLKKSDIPPPVLPPQEDNMPRRAAVVQEEQEEPAHPAPRASHVEKLFFTSQSPAQRVPNISDSPRNHQPIIDMQHEYSQTDLPPKSHVRDAAVGPGRIESAVNKEQLLDTRKPSPPRSLPQRPPSKASAEAGPAVSSLPLPMSGTAALTGEHRMAPPDVLKAKKLPSPALLFRVDSEALDLSKPGMVTKNQQPPDRNLMAGRATVGDSIDLSGLTAESLRNLVSC